MHGSRMLRLLFVLAALCSAGSLFAELPSIRLDRIQPLGVSAGNSVEVDVQGRDTEDVQTLRFDHPGLSATLVKPGRFKVTASADVPPGTYDLRLVGRFGISNPRLFSVTRGLQDVPEEEPNDTPDKAQHIPLNSAINGVSDGNGQDQFLVPLKQGQRIVVDCQALRLESPLDANLILANSAGQILATNGDYFGRDPFLDFIAPADGEYLITVHDLTYRGGLPYRCLVTDFPHVENVFPRAVTAGQHVELTALGRNLGGAQAPNGELEQQKFAIDVPADAVGSRFFRFIEHPTDHSPAPTAATFLLNGYQVRAPFAERALHPVCLMVVEGAVTLEQEPNNDRQKPQAISLPVYVSGKFDVPRDADWYEFTAPESGSYSFEVASEKIGGQADPYVAVYDEQGNSLGEHDDYGPRFNAFDGHIRDPWGTFNLEANKKYRAIVQDRYSRGGPRFQYVLAIHKSVAGFDIAAIHSENPGPSGVNLWRGGANNIDLVISFHPGFNAPITVTAENLPAGVHARPTVINVNTQGTLVLWADVDAAIGEYPIRLMATAEQDGRKIQQEVRPYTRSFSDNNPGSSRPVRELVLGIRETAPYRLEIQPQQADVPQGQSLDIKIVSHRLWPDFQDKINVIPLFHTGSLQMSNVEIPAGQNEVATKITVQNGARLGPYTVTVLGQAQVRFDKDPQKTDKPQTLVSSPSVPVTINVLEQKK